MRVKVAARQCDYVLEVRLFGHIKKIQHMQTSDPSRLPYRQHGMKIIEVSFIVRDKKTSLQFGDPRVIDDIVIPVRRYGKFDGSRNIPLAVILRLSCSGITNIKLRTAKCRNIAITSSINGNLCFNNFQPSVTTNKNSFNQIALHQGITHNSPGEKSTVRIQYRVQVIKLSSCLLRHIALESKTLRIFTLLFEEIIIPHSVVVTHNTSHGLGTTEIIEIIHHDCINSFLRGTHCNKGATGSPTGYEHLTRLFIAYQFRKVKLHGFQRNL